MNEMEKVALQIVMKEKLESIQSKIEEKIEGYRRKDIEADIFRSLLTSKYQVTIPQMIRTSLSLKTKEYVRFIHSDTNFYDMKVFMIEKSDSDEDYAVSTKGQITLRKQFRENLGLKAGQELLFISEEGLHFMIIVEKNKNQYVDMESMAQLKELYQEANFYNLSTVSVINISNGIESQIMNYYVHIHEEYESLTLFNEKSSTSMNIEILNGQWYINQNPIAIFQEAFGLQTWNLDLSINPAMKNKYVESRKKEWSNFVDFLTTHPTIKFLLIDEPKMDKYSKNHHLVTNYGNIIKLFLSELKKAGIYIHLMITPMKDSVLMLERSITTHYNELIRVKLNESVFGGIEEICTITFNNYKNQLEFKSHYRSL